MQVGTYQDGRPLNYDEATKQFSVGEAHVTAEQVLAYDGAGQIAWGSDELRDWVHSSIAAFYGVAETGPAGGEQPKQRGRWVIPVVIGVAALFVICVVVVSLTPQGGKETTPETPPNNKEKTERTAVMGTPFRIGNAEVNIENLVAVKQIGNEFMSKKGDFRVVTLTIKNVSKEQFTTDSNNFKLIGSNGAEYSTDADTLTYLDPKDSLILEAINPGVSKSGKLIFAVPGNAKITAVRVLGGAGDQPVDCKVK